MVIFLDEKSKGKTQIYFTFKRVCICISDVGNFEKFHFSYKSKCSTSRESFLPDDESHHFKLVRLQLFKEKQRLFKIFLNSGEIEVEWNELCRLVYTHLSFSRLRRSFGQNFYHIFFLVSLTVSHFRFVNIKRIIFMIGVTHSVYVRVAAETA